MDNNFISGYICKQCWSTRNDCPCTLAERQQSVLDGKQISAGAKAKTVTSTVMPCPFTGRKMFCVGPNFLCRTKNLFTYCASHKHFVPDKKMICIQ